MTNKEKERLADKARTEMAKKVHDEFNKKTGPHPANKNAIETFKKQWGKKLDDKMAYIDRRERAGHYEKNPDDFKKDWDDAYYARFILHINDRNWEEYLG